MAKCKEAHIKCSAHGKAEPSNQKQVVKEWKTLWSITAPPKMLIVLWRFAHDCLTTGQQLKHRKIQTSELCPYCGKDENLYHAFIGCHYVADIWKEIKRRCGLQLSKVWMGLPRNWLFEYLSSCTKSEATLLAITFWHIWESRNAVRNGEAEIHPSCWVEKILTYVDMVLLHCFKFSFSNRCESTRQSNWNPPPEGWIMINVDATIFEDSNWMGLGLGLGLGLVIRNHKGDFIVAIRQGIEKITNPELAEMLAFRWAVHFATQLSYNQVIVVSDCLTLINKLDAPCRDRSHTRIIIEDIKCMSSTFSITFLFKHVSEKCNEVAHVLAKSAGCLDKSVWFNVPPDFILDELCNDQCK
jgi:hypothetical protein